MDEIASASGVAKGTVYRYFASKEDLLDQLLKTTSRRIAERFASAFVDSGDVIDQIRIFIEQWMAFIEENHTLYRLIQAEGINGTSGRQTMFYEYLIEDFPMIKERVVAMDTVGALKTANFYTVAYGMLGFIDGVVRKWFRSGMDYPLKDELPVVLEMLFNGFLHDETRRHAFFVPPESRSENSRGN
jgi:AcrR family transcriptional regulator